MEKKAKRQTYKYQTLSCCAPFHNHTSTTLTAIKKIGGGEYVLKSAVGRVRPHSKDSDCRCDARYAIDGKSVVLDNEPGRYYRIYWL